MEFLDSENTFCKRQLFQYVIDGKSRKIQKILERDGSISIDITNNKGQTLLYVSCLYQRLKVAVVLLQFGADPNHRCHDGSTPTHAAAYSCCPETLRYVVEDYGGDMRLHDKQMRTPKDWAMRAGRSANRKVLRLIEMWQEQVNKKMLPNCSYRHGVTKVSKSEEMLKRNLKIDYCGYGSFVHSPKIPNSGYVGVAAVVPLALPTQITSSGGISLNFKIPPSFTMEEALWCHHRVMIKRSRGKSLALMQATEDLLIAEAKACRMLRHPNLLLLMAICLISPEENFTCAPRHWLVYECFSLGSLYHALHKMKRNFLPTQAAKILLQIADALSFIHQRGFIHSALTSHAIYLSDDLTAKLGDMFSVSCNGSDSSTPASTVVMPHFIRWMAPEVILKGSVSPKTDVYSFCMTISETFSGSIPWYGCDNKSIEDHIKERRNYFVLPDWIPTELNEVLENGLKFHSHNRNVTIGDIKGCISALLLSGKLEAMVKCLRGENTSKVSTCKEIFSDQHQSVNATVPYQSAEQDGVDSEAHAAIGMDVPDAKPFLTTEPKNASPTDRNPDTDVNRELEDIQKRHSAMEKADFLKATGKSFTHEPDLPRLDHLLNSRRPHSCSIVTQDGLARELLPTFRNNSYPDITLEQPPPPSYNAVTKDTGGKVDSASRHDNATFLNDPSGSNFSVKGPPSRVYSPTCLGQPVALENHDKLQQLHPSVISHHEANSAANPRAQSLQIREIETAPSYSVQKQPIDPTRSDPESQTQQIHQADKYASPDQPDLMGSIVYPEGEMRHICQLNTLSSLRGQHHDLEPSVKTSNARPEVFHSQNSSSFPVDDFSTNSKYDDRVNLPKFSSNSGVWRKPTRQLQHSQSLSIPLTRQQPGPEPEDVPDHALRRSHVMSPTIRKKMQSFPNRKMRWSTSALVGRKNINYADYSTDEMYDIGNDDLEYIFESFAERKSLIQIPPSYTCSPDNYIEGKEQSSYHFPSTKTSPEKTMLFVPDNYTEIEKEQSTSNLSTTEIYPEKTMPVVPNNHIGAEKKQSACNLSSKETSPETTMASVPLGVSTDDDDELHSFHSSVHGAHLDYDGSGSSKSKFKSASSSLSISDQDGHEFNAEKCDDLPPAAPIIENFSHSDIAHDQSDTNSSKADAFQNGVDLAAIIHETSENSVSELHSDVVTDCLPCDEELQGDHIVQIQRKSEDDPQFIYVASELNRDVVTDRLQSEEKLQDDNTVQMLSQSIVDPQLSYTEDLQDDNSEAKFSDTDHDCTDIIGGSYADLTNENAESLEFVAPIQIEEFKLDSVSPQALSDKSEEDEITVAEVSIMNGSNTAHTQTISPALPELISRGTNTIQQFWEYGNTFDKLHNAAAPQEEHNQGHNSAVSSEFVTCLDQEAEEETSAQNTFIAKESNLEGNSSGRQSPGEFNNVEDGFSPVQTPQEAGESMPATLTSPTSSGKLGNDLIHSQKELEVTETVKSSLEPIDSAIQTPSKWSFQKKLCLFKVAADSGNASNLEKKVLAQNTLSKVRQTAEMYENMSPLNSARDTIPQNDRRSPSFLGTNDDSCSTVDSSKFFQDKAGENFETSTPVSLTISTPNQIMVQCRSAITPRTFEEVRRDIEDASVQKCHFIGNINRECVHHPQAHVFENSQTLSDDSEKLPDEQASDCRPTVDSSDSSKVSAVCPAENEDSTFDELRVNVPKLEEIRKMVQGILQNMIERAISTLDRINDQNYDASSPSQLLTSPDSSGFSLTALPKNAVVNDSKKPRICKSVPSISDAINDSTPVKPHLPSIRPSHSMSDIDSFHLHNASEGHAQEFSSYLSDAEGQQYTSKYYRSVDTSIWSL